MQTENRLFDDAIKGVFKIVGSFFKLKKRLCKTQQQNSQSFEEKSISKEKQKDK